MLYVRDRKKVVNHILNDAPLDAKPPNAEVCYDTYVDRFGRESSPDNWPYEPAENCLPSEGMCNPIRVAEIRREQVDLKMRGAPGPDKSITSKLVKRVPCKILEPIFNAWLVTTCVPQQLKKCQTTLLPKGARGLEDLSNWRLMTIGCGSSS